MKTLRKVQTQGHSAMISIPKFICEMIDIKEGDKLSFELVGKKIIVKKEEN